MAILGRVIDLTAPDNIRVGLKQADQFLGGWHRLISQDTPSRLVNDLFQTRQEGLTDVDEPSSLLPGVSLDGYQDLLYLFDRGPCYLEEMARKYELPDASKALRCLGG